MLETLARLVALDVMKMDLHDPMAVHDLRAASLVKEVLNLLENCGSSERHRNDLYILSVLESNLRFLRSQK